MSESESPFFTPVGTRRRFFQWIIGGIGAAIGAALAIPLAGYVISPALKRRAETWVDVGSASDLPAGGPKQLDYVAAVHDGWLETTTHKAVWAVKQPDGSVVVYSPICPHLGCGYRWDEPDHLFKCPCHGSRYDLSGAVRGGPAPRPLDRLPVKIEDGRLLVIYKEFKAGLPKAVEL